MNITAGQLGFIRTVASIGVWALATAVLTYLSDAAHLTPAFSPWIAAIIAGIAGQVEHKLEAEGKGALFGAVR